MSEDPKLTLRPKGSKSDVRLNGGLYLVATPIGNARDITLRALDILATVDKIYAEDTRVSAKLLVMHALSRPLHSYREHNAETADQKILEELGRGLSIALMSDAGTPLISDPGQSLVERAGAGGFNVIPVPGPSAAIAALTASGLPAAQFFFAGFLPPKENDRRRAIRQLEAIPGTLIFYEAPGRLVETLKDLQTILGDRKAAVARELTKLHEEILTRPLNALIAEYEQRTEVRGEIVILVAPPSAESITVDKSEIDRVLMRYLQAHPVKEAAAIVAAELGLPRRTVYARALVLKKSNES